MQNQVTDQHPAPQHEAPLAQRLRRGIAIATLGISSVSMAGCSLDLNNGTPAESTSPLTTSGYEPASPTDGIIKTIADVEAVTEGVLSDYPNVAELRKLVSSLTPEEQAQFDSLTGTLDALEVGQKIDDVSKSYADYSDIRADLSTVTDPVLKTEALKIVDSYDAVDAVQDAQNYGVDIGEARTEIADIQDPGIRATAAYTIDAIDAQDVISNIQGYGSTDKAREDIADIVDPNIRFDTELAIQAAEKRVALENEGTYSGDEYSEATSVETDKELEAIKRVGAASSAISDIHLEAIKSQGDLSTKKYDELKNITGDITEFVKGHNALEIDPTKKVQIELMNNLEAPVDLTGVGGAKIIHATVQMPYHDGRVKMDLPQFAEIYAENGALTLNIDEHSGLSEATKKQLKDIYKNIEPLLEAAFASGDVASVHFLASTDYDPYYDGVDRGLYVILPADNSTSVEQLGSGITHESIHALTRSALHQSPEFGGPTPAEVEQLTATCTAMREVAYSQVKAHLGALYEDMSALYDVVKPEHKELINSVRESLENGSFEELLISLDDNVEDSMLNDCNTMDLESLIRAVADANGLEYEPSDLSYITKETPYTTANYDWHSAEWDYTVYAKLNESAFVTTDYEFKDSLGHSEENASELIATLMDVSIAYTPETIALIKSMGDEERAATIATLRMSIDFISARHPSLVGYLSQLENNVLTQVNQ